MPQIPIESYQTAWDVDNHAGFINIKGQGHPQPLRLQNLPAPEFSAMAILLGHADGAYWDTEKKCIVSRPDAV